MNDFAFDSKSCYVLCLKHGYSEVALTFQDKIQTCLTLWLTHQKGRNGWKDLKGEMNLGYYCTLSN